MFLAYGEGGSCQKEEEIDMSDTQLCVVIEKESRSRLRREADKRGVSVSQIVRSIISDGIERIDGV